MIDIARSRTREIGLRDGLCTINGIPCPAAYAKTGFGWRSRTSFMYELGHTTNGWEIMLVSYRGR
jgi:hypothetical protein